jgi:Uri superfamily endonuclease
MRHDKSVDWHIDQLTERGIIIGSWIVPNGRQCELVAIYADPGFRQ